MKLRCCPHGIFAALLLVILSFSVFSQAKPAAKSPVKKINAAAQPISENPKRPVALIFISNEPIKGFFVSASPSGIKISVGKNILDFEWNEIKQVIFDDEKTQVSNTSELLKKESQESSKSKIAVDNALKSLRKLAAATEIGVNFQEYSSRVIDVKTEVNESLIDIPEGETRDEIQKAMEAYGDANAAWSKMYRGSLFPDLEPGKSLQSKYSIPIDRSIGMPLLNQSAVLNTIWSVAKKHMETASRLNATMQ